MKLLFKKFETIILIVSKKRALRREYASKKCLIFSKRFYIIQLSGGNMIYSFDDLQIKKIEGMVPYYKEYLDNLQMYDLTKERNFNINV